MIMEPNRRPRDRRSLRHVSLGRRLEVLQLIRAGRISPQAAASLMNVSIQEVRRWQTTHSADQIVSLRRQDGPEATSEELHLLARRRRLVRLLRTIDMNVRDLHARLVASSRATRGTAA
jgi:hypothetical protein